jgi:hypothetical protein
MLNNFNKNCRNNRNISIFTSISYHSVFTRPPFLFFQHNQQYDTLLPIVPCKHKLKAGIAYRMCSHCLFPAYWQVVNGLLTTCYKVVELNRLVTSCSNNLLSSCGLTICQQVVSDNLVETWHSNSVVTTCWQACYKPVANTSCWKVVRFSSVYKEANVLDAY